MQRTLPERNGRSSPCSASVCPLSPRLAFSYHRTVSRKPDTCCKTAYRRRPSAVLCSATGSPSTAPADRTCPCASSTPSSGLLEACRQVSVCSRRRSFLADQHICFYALRSCRLPQIVG